MIKLFLSWLLLSISFLTIAATIKPNDLNAPPSKSLDQKNKIVQLPTQTISFTNNDTIFSSRNTLVQQEKPHLLPSHSLKSFVKKLDQEYGDNELVQESLTALYETKQLWDEADAMANNFTYDLLFTLKLEHLIEHDLALLPQTSNAYIFSKKNTKASIQYHKTSDISPYQIEKNHIKTSSDDLIELDTTFLASLYRISTLYYFLAFYILLIFLQWLIKFVLHLLP